MRIVAVWQQRLCFHFADRDPDLLPADVPAEAALPGSAEQDLHRGPAAVLHGHGPAVSQHHLLPHEPGHAVQKGVNSGLVKMAMCK